MREEVTANAEDRAMARFMSAFTHTFRSRLNAVLGSLELVSQTQLDDTQSRFVDTAVDEGRALLQLVNDALDLARIDAARQLSDQHRARRARRRGRPA